jgi:hypothetical protein
MVRRLRAFQPSALLLEGRILLARVHVPLPPPTIATPTLIAPAIASEGSVWFLGAQSSAATKQQVVQQGGEATVWLRTTLFGAPLQVQVTTDPSSPAVGVNLPAVNQTVAFADGQDIGENQNLTSVTIPTYAGAPNPGEVDVNLTITPIDAPPGLTVEGGPLELRIMAPDATTPPRIIGVTGSPEGIKLAFSKPLNPLQASNVHNYVVRSNWTTYSLNDHFLASVFGFLSPDTALGGNKTTHSTKSVPLRSASYDPADFTVTLIPKHRLSYSPNGSIVVSTRSPAKTSASLRQGSSSAQGLTDLDGNAINQGGKPGEFRITVSSGYTPLG